MLASFYSISSNSEGSASINTQKFAPSGYLRVPKCIVVFIEKLNTRSASSTWCSEKSEYLKLKSVHLVSTTPSTFYHFYHGLVWFTIIAILYIRRYSTANSMAELDKIKCHHVRQDKNANTRFLFATRGTRAFHVASGDRFKGALDEIW